MNGYQSLANAIILQAVKDYRESIRLLEMNPNDKMAQREKRSIERFFHSNWFSILTDLDGELLLKKLKEEVSE